MNKLFILVGFTLHFSLLFSQDCCNMNIYTEDETMKLSAYGKALEKSILEKNPADSVKIASMTGDFKNDCCYSDSSIIKISIYLRELEKLDSINKIVPEVVAVDTLPVVPEVPVVPVVTKPSIGEIVYFGTNSSQIKVSKLDLLVAAMKADPSINIAIDGHTDATASDDYNLALSKRRAKAVKDYLTSKGIAASRITSNFYGESKPAASNDTEEGKALNRRVAISVK
jgi:outer membrane protein OmpA-like peptidoglycan-associated protein